MLAYNAQICMHLGELSLCVIFYVGMVLIRMGSSSNIHCSEDAQILAMRRLPELIFGYIEGGTGREICVDNNVASFDLVKLQPRVLENVEHRTTDIKFLNQSYSVPFGIAPMGMCNVVHPRSDELLARMAKRYNIPLGLSTAASTTLEKVYSFAPDQVWFQLYVLPPLEHALSLVRRAEEAGYKILVLTVDVPQISRRIRDLRSGFKVDFRFGKRQIYDLARHPVYSLRMLFSGRPKPAHFSLDGEEFNRSASRALANWTFLKELRDRWKGKLIIKGVSSIPDALRIKNIGVDAIWVSNHGGRQLDSAPATINILPEFRDALGASYPIILDSGVRSGEDVLKALVCGANFVMLGRPWLYALGAEGERGLQSLYDALSFDLSAAMAQIGVCSLNELGTWNLASSFRNRAGLNVEETRLRMGRSESG